MFRRVEIPDNYEKAFCDLRKAVELSDSIPYDEPVCLRSVSYVLYILWAQNSS